MICVCYVCVKFCKCAYFMVVFVIFLWVSLTFGFDCIGLWVFAQHFCFGLVNNLADRWVSYYVYCVLLQRSGFGGIVVVVLFSCYVCGLRV